jgi:hypothetical protein
LTCPTWGSAATQERFDDFWPAARGSEDAIGRPRGSTVDDSGEAGAVELLLQARAAAVGLAKAGDQVIDLIGRIVPSGEHLPAVR